MIPRAELINYLEEHEQRNEALFDRIDRRLGAIEDHLLATPPPQDPREDPCVEAVQRPRRAGRKTDGILRVGLTTYYIIRMESFYFSLPSPSNVFASTPA